MKWPLELKNFLKVELGIGDMTKERLLERVKQ